MSYVLPILILAFIVITSGLDARSRKRKGTPQVQSRPILEDLASILGREEEEPEEEPEEELREEAPAEEAAVQREDRPQAPAVAEEGERAVRRAPKEEPAETENPEPKLRIDKKNLILYSEILKPKFDD